MQKSLLLKSLLFFFPIAGLLAQAPTPEENSLLWEISGKNTTKSSYLFGTIHLIGKQDFFMPEEAKNALLLADKIAFEVDMDDMDDMGAMMSLMMNAFMADGKSLQELLSEADYAIVEKHFSTIGLPMMFFDRLKPMFLSFMDPEAMLGGGDTNGMVSYELELMKIAQENNKEVEGLETIEFQMSLFDSIPYEEQAKMLVESIKTGGSQSDEFDKLVEMYKKGDLGAMQKAMSGDTEGIGKYEELLLIRRNKNWIPTMYKKMGEGPMFFAVGAGHLGGEKGVISLLRQAGYQVSPIKKSKRL